MPTLPYARSDARDWARQTMQGVFNVVIPSFSGDLQSLNEAGIRHDVDLNVDNGFAGFLLVSEVATTVEEYLDFVRVAHEQAGDRQMLIHHASFNSLDQNVEVANRAAERGAQLTLLSYPPSFYPGSEDDIEQYTRAFCSQVDMAVMLFPVPLWDFERIHPACLSADLMGRLIDDVPTIVAIKAEGGHPSIGGFTESWNRFGERVVVTMPLENQAIPLATVLPLQCIATSNTESMADAVPRMLALARKGDKDAAMELFWQVDPARRANATIGAIGGTNSVHRMAWKYQAWLTGYNGGPLRMPTPRLNAGQMKTLRGGLAASGLPVTADPDERFHAGRNPT